jgi:hypothetical protein
MINTHRFFYAMLFSVALGGHVATAETARYHNQEYGFSIEIPRDWVHLPEEAVYVEGVAHPTWKFEPKDTSFPALNLRVSDYKAFGIKGQITEAGIQAAINSARRTGAKHSYGEVITSSYDPNTRTYTQVVDFQMQDVGTIRSANIMAFGRYFLAGLTYMDLADDWSAAAQLRETVLASFAFDAGSAYISDAADNAAERQGQAIGRLVGHLFFVVILLSAIIAIARACTRMFKSCLASRVGGNANRDKHG